MIWVALSLYAAGAFLMASWGEDISDGSRPVPSFFAVVLWPLVIVVAALSCLSWKDRA